MGEEPPALRIGELSRRLGISEHVLRAWERRYGVLRPHRSTGGYRLYSAADERRLRRMQVHLAQGLSAAQAAQAALSEEPQPPPATNTGTGDADLAGAAADLAWSLESFDEPGAQAALDRLLGSFTVGTVLREVILPYLHDLGERWAQGDASIAREHFASNVLRGRLASLARGWGTGYGPRAVLACAPGEQHDLGLLSFGIVAHQHGWRIEYLGPDTPLAELTQVARELSPALAVVVAVLPGRLYGLAAGLSEAASLVPLALAGAGASRALASKVGARLLAGDPVTEAERLVLPSA